MCTKLVYTISHHDPSPGIGYSELLDKKLFHVLKQYKNAIGNTAKCWDMYKKQSNLYELVFTTSNELPSLVDLNPHSRSFFKHWEILSDFESELGFLQGVGLRCAFLAEGPGGFIEAFVRWRQMKNQYADHLFGATLISNDRMVPTWKFEKEYLDRHNIKLLYGPGGDGSLYNMNNIDSFVDDIGSCSCDYITSDGGFDFSGNFNDQELDSLLLIMCEIYTALRLQTIGGAFLLKLYDVSRVETRALLNILYESYASITWIKPHTSRPANSEKYILCRGFEGVGGDVLNTLRRAILKQDYDELLNVVEPSGEFIEAIAMYNVVFSIKQIVNINATIALIREKTTMWHNAKKQVETALRWCHKYGIPINIDNLHFYQRLRQN